MKNSILLISFIWSFLFSDPSQSDTTKNIKMKSVDYLGNSMTVITINPNSMSFGVKHRKDLNDDFYMNANFFDKSGVEIGEVVMDGKIINKRTKGGGFFYVKNGKPGVSLTNRPKNVQFSVQTNYIGVVNGKINSKVVDRKINQKGACRTILGKNKNGEIVIIHSNTMSLVSMRQISEFAVTQGMINGLLFDGGSSVDIFVNTKDLKYSFKSVPSFAKPLMGIDEPPIYIVGNEKD